MGFRFQRRIKIAPGIRLNFSKSGVSTSIGGKGLTYNSRGIVTTGIPGTGLSYRHQLNNNGPKPPSDKQDSMGPRPDRQSGTNSFLLWTGIGLIILGGIVPVAAWIGLALIVIS